MCCVADSNDSWYRRDIRQSVQSGADQLEQEIQNMNNYQHLCWYQQRAEIEILEDNFVKKVDEQRAVIEMLVDDIKKSRMFIKRIQKVVDVRRAEIEMLLDDNKNYRLTIDKQSESHRAKIEFLEDLFAKKTDEQRAEIELLQESSKLSC